MMVVADTTPLNYLVLIVVIDVLPALYAGVLIPPAVHRELLRPQTPAVVAAWAASLPTWCQVRALSSTPHSSLAKLDAGERDAIQLAIKTGAEALLIDEREGRREAARHNLRVIGTLAILEAAADRNVIDFSIALTRLEATNFRLSAKVRDQFTQRNL